MKIQAAVTHAAHAPMDIEELELEDPRADEILVRVVGTGICHTDVVMRDHALPTPHPAVLGHEGAGIVERVGAAVTSVEPGDHVVMSFNSCGRCPACVDGAPSYCHAFFPLNILGARLDGSTPLSGASGPVHGNIFGQSSFATHALCNERNVVKVDKDLDLHMLGPLGCGVLTGAGSVFNSLELRAGRSIAVFGVGAVGLSAIMAARVVGAAAIMAVDLNADRLELATSLGATHTINAGTSDVLEAINAISPVGVDYVLDTTGNLGVIHTAVAALAPRGKCGLIGAMPPGSKLDLDTTYLMSGGRAVMGIVEGSADPQQLIPRLIGLWREGRFPFDRLISYYSFAAINDAIADAEKGTAVKPVLRMD
ncbi:NAD(P)-dependent alcohol dehydrogenase [Novosphingobium sp.]|uniref:NAD(P)-dependent alcohol dehydrogenase n=1 Tax=Novosphingobium sp. TaxID=1874826 RepID=UPI0035B26D50